MLEQLGADLDHDIEFARIQLRFLSEPDLYVTWFRRPSLKDRRSLDHGARHEHAFSARLVACR